MLQTVLHVVKLDARRWRGRLRLLLRLKRHLLRGETLDIYPSGLALALLLPLYQTDALAGVQLGQQSHGLAPSAVQTAAYLIHSVVNVDTPGIIVSLIFDGQAHTVKQHPVEQLGVCGEVLKQGVGDKLAGDTEIAKLHRLVTVKVA